MATTTTATIDAKGASDKGRPKTRRGKRAGAQTHPKTMLTVVEPAEDIKDLNAVKENHQKEKRKRGKRGTPNLSNNVPEAAILDTIESQLEKQRTQYSEFEPPMTISTFESSELPQLQTDIKNYLVSIEKTLKQNAFTDDEDKDIFLRNVYREVQGHEAEMCGDADGSRILQVLLMVSNDFHIRVFFTAIHPSIEALSCNQFASHVIETLLVLAADVCHRELLGTSVVETDIQLQTIEELILATCDDLDGNWEMLCKHRYGSHVLRTLLTVLSPSTSPKDQKLLRSEKSKTYQKRVADHDAELNHTVPILKSIENRSVPDSFSIKMRNIAEKITTIDVRVLRQLSIHAVASPLLQLLLPHTPLLAKKIVLEEDGLAVTEFTHVMSQDRVGSHLLQLILEHLSLKDYAIMFIYFSSRLVEYSFHALSNFCVQSLLKHVREEAQASQVATLLFPNMKKLVRNRSGVVVSLSQLCISFPSIQPRFFSAFLELFACEKMEVFEKTLCFEGDKPSIQGSLILQNTLQFSSPIAHIYAHSFYSNKEKAISFALDASASRCVESMFKSTSITTEVKDKASDAFTDTCVRLACDKFGSHVIDSVFSGCSTSIKASVCEELVAGKLQVQKSHFGRFCWANCKVEEYTRSYQIWEERQNGVSRKAEMFDEIIHDNIESKAATVLKEKKFKTKSVVLDKIFYPADDIVHEDVDVVKKKKDKKRKNPAKDESLDFLMNILTATKKTRRN